MRVKFTVEIPESSADPGADGREVRRSLAGLALAAEAVGIDRLLVAERRDGQDLAALASCVIHATASLGVQLEHRAGIVPPEVAARQIATLDQLSGGRMTVRFMPGGSEMLSHEQRLAGLDEYVMLLKRLWSNDKPIDYEGRFHRLRAGFSGAKPFGGASVPVALGGISGTAVNVAARHADIFVLPAVTCGEARRTIGRVKAAAACHRRADTMRFALPVRPYVGRPGGLGPTGPTSHDRDDGLTVAGSPEKIALTLLDYCEIGVTDFVVKGLPTPSEISTFGRTVVPLVRRRLARRQEDAGDQFGPRSANLILGRWSRYPA